MHTTKATHEGVFAAGEGTLLAAIDSVTWERRGFLGRLVQTGRPEDTSIANDQAEIVAEDRAEAEIAA